MIAFGGNRENGARNDANIFLGATEDEVRIVRGGWEDRRERKVRNTAVTKKETAITTLGGRMVCISPATVAGDLLAVQLRHAIDAHPTPGKKSKTVSKVLGGLVL